MVEQLTLSKRLETITKYLPKQAIFADIGSDHAYLPIAVCQRDDSAHAIAGELNKGPYLAAVEHVKKYQLAERIQVIQGDGLDVIRNHPVKQIVIAGMGGGLIRSILERGKDTLKTVERLILQPNVDSQYIREWTNANDFSLVDEDILEEDGHIYEILVLDKSEQAKSTLLSDQACLFGPFLLEQRNDTFTKKWQRELVNYQRIINQMEQAKVLDVAKIAEYNCRIKWIEQVINHD